jgi:hypothetical protein
MSLTCFPTLRENPFRRIPHLALTVSCTDHVRHAAVIYRMHERGGFFYIVEHGSVSLDRRADMQRVLASPAAVLARSNPARDAQEHALCLVEPGEFFGEHCLYEDIASTRLETAVAATHVRVLTLSHDDFHELARSHPTFGAQMREVCVCRAALTGVLPLPPLLAPRPRLSRHLSGRLQPSPHAPASPAPGDTSHTPTAYHRQSGSTSPPYLLQKSAILAPKFPTDKPAVAVNKLQDPPELSPRSDGALSKGGAGVACYCLQNPEYCTVTEQGESDGHECGGLLQSSGIDTQIAQVRPGSYECRVRRMRMDGLQTSATGDILFIGITTGDGWLTGDSTCVLSAVCSGSPHWRSTAHLHLQAGPGTCPPKKFWAEPSKRSNILSIRRLTSTGLMRCNSKVT